jgi:hypothetical protein
MPLRYGALGDEGKAAKRGGRWRLCCSWPRHLPEPSEDMLRGAPRVIDVLKLFGALLVSAHWVRLARRHPPSPDDTPAVRPNKPELEATTLEPQGGPKRARCLGVLFWQWNFSALAEFRARVGAEIILPYIAASVSVTPVAFAFVFIFVRGGK